MSDEKKEKVSGNESLRSVLDWISPIILAVILAILLRIFVGGATTVQGESMEPTLQNEDILFVSKLPTYGNNFDRIDIVIIDPPIEPKDQVTEEEEKLFVKRIIGMPGETVEIRDGNIYINGQLLREFYLGEPETGTYNESKWVLGDDEYFVLGDNRAPGRSNDSRFFGPIKEDDILGVVKFRIWPFSSIGGVK